ncbi:MAG: nucleotidyltransferase domain-containing protein [Pseudobdellovibrio sp.]
MATNKKQNIDQIVKVLKQEFKPTRLFLFGSQANNTNQPNSDYDFVVVVPKATKSRLDNMSKARELLHKKCGISADVFVFSEKEFNETKEDFSSIAETALNTGKEIDLV